MLCYENLTRYAAMIITKSIFITIIANIDNTEHVLLLNFYFYFINAFTLLSVA